LSLAIASQRKDMSEGFTRNVWLFSILGVMSASVWIELLAKPGTLTRAQSGLTSVPHPITAVKRRGRRVSRYAQITRIAIRNGLGPSLGLGRHIEGGEARQVPFARRLRHSLEQSGGMFVKAGQVRPRARTSSRRPSQRSCRTSRTTSRGRRPTACGSSSRTSWGRRSTRSSPSSTRSRWRRRRSARRIEHACTAGSRWW
jgi:hypothetical protein